MTTIGMMRPLLWLAALALIPVLQLIVGVLSLGSSDPIDPPFEFIATVFLYLFAADVGWTLLGRTIPAGLGGAGAAVLLLAYGVPAALNAGVSDASEKAASGDGAPASVGSPRVIALLSPYEHTRDRWQVETDCTLLCQRLLYWGGREAVLMGATPPGGDPAGASGLIRYAIERRPTCPAIKVPEASVLPQQMRHGDSYATSETVEGRIALGDCLIATPGDIAEAELVATRSEPAFDVWQRAASRPSTVASWRSAAYRRVDGKWIRIGQATGRIFSRARSPFRLSPTGFGPGKIASDEARATAEDPLMIEHMLAPWLGWPEGMPGSPRKRAAGHGSTTAGS